MTAMGIGNRANQTVGARAGFGEAWHYGSPGRNSHPDSHLETCGTACTEFASDQDDDRPD